MIVYRCMSGPTELLRPTAAGERQERVFPIGAVGVDGPSLARSACRSVLLGVTFLHDACRHPEGSLER